MKRLLSGLLIIISVLLTSCDLFMDYQKPDLYLITIGLSYHQHTPLPFPETGELATLQNTHKDADTVKALFTGLADQAGMDWYAIDYRDSYDGIPEGASGHWTNDGKAEFTLTSNTDRYEIHSSGSGKGYDEITQLQSPKGWILGQIKELLGSCTAPTGNDIVLLYYAGHGIPVSGHIWTVPGLNPSYKLDKEEEKAIFTENDLFGPSGLFSAVDGRKVLILDSCFSGAMIGSRGPDADNITGGGGNSHNDPDNPYFEGWFGLREYGSDDLMSGDNELQLPEDATDDADRAITDATCGAKCPKPDVYVITSASPEQKASDGDDTKPYGPFVEAIVESIQPGFTLKGSDPVHYGGTRITLNDLYRMVRKAFYHDPKQDPQTLLTRYDIVLFDFKR